MYPGLPIRAQCEPAFFTRVIIISAFSHSSVTTHKSHNLSSQISPLLTAIHACLLFWASLQNIPFRLLDQPFNLQYRQGFETKALFLEPKNRIKPRINRTEQEPRAKQNANPSNRTEPKVKSRNLHYVTNRFNRKPNRRLENQFKPRVVVDVWCLKPRTNRTEPNRALFETRAERLQSKSTQPQEQLLGGSD